MIRGHLVSVGSEQASGLPESTALLGFNEPNFPDQCPGVTGVSECQKDSKQRRLSELRADLDPLTVIALEDAKYRLYRLASEG